MGGGGHMMNRMGLPGQLPGRPPMQPPFMGGFPPPQALPSNVCRDFVRGRCNRQMTCRFSHNFGPGMGGGPPPMGGPPAGGDRILPGDWACPECNYHNYANNNLCRRCKTPKPMRPSVVQQSHPVHQVAPMQMQMQNAGVGGGLPPQAVNHAAMVKPEDQPCRDLLRTGMCPRQPNCRFSHGAEVRQLRAELNYSILDISWPITRDMTSWRDTDDRVSFEQVKSWASDKCRSTVVNCLSVHSGTHVVAPAHCLEEGDTVEKLPLGRFCGRCVVLDLTGLSDADGRFVTRADLERFGEALSGKFAPRPSVVLLKTSNSSLRRSAPFKSDFVALAADAAEYLVSLRVRAVGIDYLAIWAGTNAEADGELASHKILLQNGIGVIEGLRLGHVPDFSAATLADCRQKYESKSESPADDSAHASSATAGSPSSATTVSGMFSLMCLPIALQGVEGAPARAFLLPDV